MHNTINIALQKRLTSVLTFKHAKKTMYVNKHNTNKKQFNSNAQMFISELLSELELVAIVMLTDYTITEMYIQYLSAECDIEYAIAYIL